MQGGCQRDFLELSDDENSLTADFNIYCMNIAGTLSYVVRGKEKIFQSVKPKCCNFLF